MPQTERYVLSDKVIEDKNSIQAQYNKLELDREVYLERARDCSELTIPTLFPPKSAHGATEYKSPYQSIGARGVMNLASKLMLALFPPQAPFFRLSMDDLVFKQIEGDPEQKQTLEMEVSYLANILGKDVEDIL